jgi:hypothetical protein
MLGMPLVVGEPVAKKQRTAEYRTAEQENVEGRGAPAYLHFCGSLLHKPGRAQEDAFVRRKGDLF